MMSAHNSGGAVSAFGAMAALLAREHHGLPIWFVALAISASLLFGLLSASSRHRDMIERKEARRVALINAGALWIMAASIVTLAELDIAGAMITALALGLIGTRALNVLEKRWLRWFGEQDTLP